MKYEEMSDFEINSAVAAIVTGGDVIEKHDMAEAPTAEGVQVIYKIGVHGEFLDYCNNPSDAWPIIVDNAISITSIGDLNWNADSLISIEESANDYNNFECVSACSSQDKNPLRAAMTCFLKMKDAESNAN